MDVKKYFDEVMNKLEKMTFEEIEEKLKEVGVQKLEVVEKTSISIEARTHYSVNESPYRFSNTQFTSAEQIEEYGVAA